MEIGTKIKLFAVLTLSVWAIAGLISFAAGGVKQTQDYAAISQITTTLDFVALPVLVASVLLFRSIHKALGIWGGFGGALGFIGNLFIVGLLGPFLAVIYYIAYRRGGFAHAGGMTSAKLPRPQSATQDQEEYLREFEREEEK